MKSNMRLIIIMILVSLLTTAYGENDFKYYVMGDSTSEGCITTSDPKGSCLNAVKVEINALDVKKVNVHASYTLVNTGDVEKKIDLILPFSKIPEDLNITVNSESISFKEKPYRCVLDGYDMIHDQQAFRELDELVNQFKYKKDRDFKMKSAVFSCEISAEANVIILVSYTRDLTYYNYSNLTEKVKSEISGKELWKYFPAGLYAERNYEPQDPWYVDSKAINEVVEKLYADTQGHQYYYGYLFDSAKAWNHPIDSIYFSFSIDQKFVEKILSEKEFHCCIQIDRDNVKDSAISAYRFNEKAERKTQYLLPKEKNERLQFIFEKMNWIPQRNPGICYLASRENGMVYKQKIPERDFLNELNQRDELAESDLINLFGRTYGYFPISLKTIDEEGEKAFNNLLLAEDIIVKYGERFSPYLRNTMKSSEDTKRRLYAWTLLARIGYQEDLDFFGVLYSDLNEKQKSVLYTWFELLKDWRIYRGEYANEEFLKLMQIRAIPKAYSEKILNHLMYDSSESIRAKSFKYLVKKRHWEQFLPEIIQTCKKGLSDEKKAALDIFARNLKCMVPHVLFFEPKLSSEEIIHKLDAIELSDKECVWAYRYFGDELLIPLKKLAASEDENDRMAAAEALAGMQTHKSYAVKMEIIEDESMDAQVRAKLIENIEYPLSEGSKMRQAFLDLVKGPIPVSEAVVTRVRPLRLFYDRDIQKYIDAYKACPSVKVQRYAADLNRMYLSEKKRFAEAVKTQKFRRLKKRGIHPNIRKKRSSGRDFSFGIGALVNLKFWNPLLKEKRIESRMLGVQHQTRWTPLKNWSAPLLANDNVWVRREVYRKILESSSTGKLEYLLPYIEREENLHCLELIYTLIGEHLKGGDKPLKADSTSLILKLQQSKSEIKQKIAWYCRLMKHNEEIEKEVCDRLVNLKSLKDPDFKVLYMYLLRYNQEVLNQCSMDLYLRAFQGLGHGIYNKLYRKNYYYSEDNCVADLIERAIKNHGLPAVELTLRIMKHTDFELDNYANGLYEFLMLADKQYYPVIQKSYANPMSVREDICYHFMLKAHFEGDASLPYLEKYLDEPQTKAIAFIVISQLMGFEKCYSLPICKKYLELYHKGELKDE